MAVVVKRPGGARSKQRLKPALKSRPAAPKSSPVARTANIWMTGVALAIGGIAVLLLVQFHAQYTVSWQSPLLFHWQWPMVVAQRTRTPDALEAQADQQHALTAYQQYACRKFGASCRVALAIQRAENPRGKCEIYHYNTDGTLDWGYFQINTVHLKRPGLVLRDLLDCRANIDFAYQLYLERGNFTAWSTYNNGLYRRYLHE